MPAPSIILLAGNRQVGKDTFYDLLAKARPGLFRGYSFADELKNDLDPISKLMFSVRTKDLDAKEKEIVRPILISYGCAWRAIDPLHWVKVVDRQIEFDRAMLDGMDGHKPTWIPVCRDVRFCNETTYFKDRFGTNNVILASISRIGAPEPTDEEKINSPLVGAMADYFVIWETLKKESDRMKHVERFLDYYSL